MAKIGSLSSLFILQSKSINFNFGHFWAKYQGYSLTFWPKLAHFHHFSFWNQSQSISILVIFGQNTKAIALLFGQNWLIFITFHSAIKVNQFQFENGHFWAKYQGYSLTFWPKLAHFHHFSFCNQSQSMSNFGHFWAKYQGYSLTVWPKLAHFHHFSFCNQSQSISILVIFGQNTKAIALLLAKIGSFSSLFILQSKSINFNFGHFWAKYQGYSLTFWPKLAHFHHFSFCNQSQSISILVIFGQNTKAIALLFGQNWLIVITFHSAIKVNQFQFWSFLGKIPRL